MIYMKLAIGYTTVADQFRGRNKTEKLWAPMCNVNFSDISDFSDLNAAFEDEFTWLVNVFDFYQKYPNDNDVTCEGWAAHHASMGRGNEHPPGINTISPLNKGQGGNFEYSRTGHCMCPVC